MNTELVQTLTTTFEAHAQRTESGVEFWLARDLQFLLGYDEWRNFHAVISKARTACEVSGHAVPDHFVDVNKTIQMPKSAERQGCGREAWERAGVRVRSVPSPSPSSPFWRGSS